MPDYEKRERIYLFILFSLVVAVVIFSVLLSSNTPLEVKTISVGYVVGDKIDFDLGANSLAFGQIKRNGFSERELKIENKYDFPIDVRVIPNKELSNLIDVDKEFRVDAKNSFFIPLTLRIPENYPSGNYTEKIKLEMRRA